MAASSKTILLELDSLEDSLKAAISRLALIIRFRKEIHSVGVQQYIDHVPEPLLDALRTNTRLVQEQLESITRKIAFAQAVHNRDWRKAQGLPLVPSNVAVSEEESSTPAVKAASLAPSTNPSPVVGSSLATISSPQNAFSVTAPSVDALNSIPNASPATDFASLLSTSAAAPLPTSSSPSSSLLNNNTTNKAPSSTAANGTTSNSSLSADLLAFLDQTTSSASSSALPAASSFSASPLKNGITSLPSSTPASSSAILPPTTSTQPQHPPHSTDASSSSSILGFLQDNSLGITNSTNDASDLSQSLNGMAHSSLSTTADPNDPAVIASLDIDALLASLPNDTNAGGGDDLLPSADDAIKALDVDDFIKSLANQN